MNSRCATSGAKHLLAMAAWGSAWTGVCTNQCQSAIDCLQIVLTDNRISWCSLSSTSTHLLYTYIYIYVYRYIIFPTHSLVHLFLCPQCFRHGVSRPQLEFGRTHGCEAVRHERSHQKRPGKCMRTSGAAFLACWPPQPPPLMHTFVDAARARDIHDARPKPQKHRSISGH